MKILSLTTNYPESHNPKTARFVHDINKEFVKLGMQVRTITLHAKGTKTNEMMDSIMVRRFRYLPENYQFNFASIPDEISKSKIGYLKMIAMSWGFFWTTYFECIKEKPDIIHAHWSFPCGYIAYLMSVFFKIPFVVTIHGGEIPLFKKFHFIRKRVINALNKSVMVCANSSYSKNEFIQMGMNKKKVIKLNVPPNFVNHSSDKKLLEEFRGKFANPSTKIILFVGRLVERKGVEYLLKAADKLKNKNIHLIISGGGGLETKLKELAKSLRIESKVTFFGRSNDEELGLLHDISDVFVCPSIVDSKGNTEYLGLVIPEAMESGLPVIASSVGGIVDTVQNEVNGLLVPPKDPGSIAKAIERVISDTDLEEKLVKNSQKTIKEFSPQTIAKNYYEIFQSALREKPT